MRLKNTFTGKLAGTVFLAAFLSLASFSDAFAADNERYKAVPLAGGTTVFVIDTRDGHMWTWINQPGSHVSASGKNPQIVYQGNVAKNMDVNTPANNKPTRK